LKKPTGFFSRETSFLIGSDPTALERDASHKLVLPLDDGLFSDRKGAPCTKPKERIEAFFLDGRYTERATEKIIELKTPTLDRIKTSPPPPRQIIPMQRSDFLKSRPKQHISVPWFLKWGPKCLPPKLLQDVVVGLTKGFPTKYRGGGDFLRDYSNQMKPEEEKKATEKAKEMVEKGWGAGPFPIPPFPNDKCPKQAIPTKSFTIPKHKWLDDGALRLIFHKSFPLGRSINSLTPRHDIKTYFPPGTFKYFCLALFISMVAEAGRGSYLSQFDAADAYKQLQVRDEDMNQQIFVADGQLWADFCASASGRYTGTTFTAHLAMRTALAAVVPLLRVYVDNYINITPVQGPKTEQIAKGETERIMKELIESKLKFHQFQGPHKN